MSIWTNCCPQSTKSSSSIKEKHSNPACDVVPAQVHILIVKLRLSARSGAWSVTERKVMLIAPGSESQHSSHEADKAAPCPQLAARTSRGMSQWVLASCSPTARFPAQSYHSPCPPKSYQTTNRITGIHLSPIHSNESFEYIPEVFKACESDPELLH